MLLGFGCIGLCARLALGFDCLRVIVGWHRCLVLWCDFSLLVFVVCGWLCCWLFILFAAVLVVDDLVSAFSVLIVLDRYGWCVLVVCLVCLIVIF